MKVDGFKLLSTSDSATRLILQLACRIPASRPHWASRVGWNHGIFPMTVKVWHIGISWFRMNLSYSWIRSNTFGVNQTLTVRIWPTHFWHFRGCRASLAVSEKSPLPVSHVMHLQARAIWFTGIWEVDCISSLQTLLSALCIEQNEVKCPVNATILPENSSLLIEHDVWCTLRGNDPRC